MFVYVLCVCCLLCCLLFDVEFMLCWFVGVLVLLLVVVGVAFVCVFRACCSTFDQICFVFCLIDLSLSFVFDVCLF